MVKTRNGNRGSALLLSMIIVIIVVGIGGAFMLETVFRGQTADRAVVLDEAQIICDAAVERVRRDLWKYRSANTWNWNDLLTYASDAQCIPTADLDTIKAAWTSQKSSSVNTAIKSAMSSGTYTDTEAPLPGSPTTPSTSDTVYVGWCRPWGQNGEASFHVVVKDNDDGDGNLLADTDFVVILVATATMPNGTQRQIEAVVQYEETIFTPGAAIMSDGTIEMGSVTVDGPDGKIFSNEDVYITGNSGTAVSVDAAGSVRNSDGTLYDGAITHSGAQVSQPIPDITMNDLKTNTAFNSGDGTKPMYILKSDGTMYLLDGSGAQTGSDLQSSSVFELKAGKWQFKTGSDYSSGTYTPASYFVEGSFDVNFNDSKQITIIATESINMTGNGTITPFITNSLAFAGKDVRMRGNTGAGQSLSTQGMVYALEQISMSGNTNFQGAAIAKDYPDSSGSLVQVSGANVAATDTTLTDSGYTTGNLAEGLSVDGSVSVTYTKTASLFKNPKESVKVNSVRRLR